MNEEMTICNEENDQLKVILFPKNSKCPEVDNIRLSMTSVEGETKTIDMTPDEALEIASKLTMAVQFYLYEGNKEYKKLLKLREEYAGRRAKELDRLGEK